jgi:hypothetical protein
MVRIRSQRCQTDRLESGQKNRKNDPQIHTKQHENTSTKINCFVQLRVSSWIIFSRIVANPMPPISIPDSKALSRMATPAILEIKITAKGSFAIMTSRAGVVARGKVFEGAWRADLSLLRQPSAVVMTICASQPLATAVCCVTEPETERGRIG